MTDANTVSEAQNLGLSAEKQRLRALVRVNLDTLKQTIADEIFEHISLKKLACLRCGLVPEFSHQRVRVIDIRKEGLQLNVDVVAFNGPWSEVRKNNKIEGKLCPTCARRAVEAPAQAMLPSEDNEGVATGPGGA